MELEQVNQTLPLSRDSHCFENSVQTDAANQKFAARGAVHTGYIEAQLAIRLLFNFVSKLSIKWKINRLGFLSIFDISCTTEKY